MSIARFPCSDGDVPQFESLLKHAMQGSSFASDYLFDELRDYLLSIANDEFPAQARAEHNPSDLVQESLLAVHQGLGDFRGSTPGDLRRWARAILQNKILDSVRRSCRRTDLTPRNRIPLAEIRESHAEQDGAEETAVRRERDWQVREAVERLPRKYRQAILLRESGRTFEEIGIALGCTRGGAQKTWARAVKRLAKELKSLDRD